MVKAHLGLKRVCQGCAAHFYDLRKSPIVCPKCSAVFDPDAFLKSKRSRVTPSLKEGADLPIFDPLTEDVPFGAEVDLDGDALIEDTSDLGGGDDMVDVMDHREEKDSV